MSGSKVPDEQPPAALPEPETDQARGLQSAVTAERWERIVRDAQGRAEVLELVEDERHTTQRSWRICLTQAAPEVGWSAYLHWKRKYEARSGPGWERLLDERLPPPPVALAEDLKVAACLLRRVDRSLGTEGARAHLVAQFGERGRISDASLRRIWAKAGLSWEPGRVSGAVPGEKVMHYGGGGGLALLGAAEAELQTGPELAKAVQAAGRSRAEEPGRKEELSEPEGSRDARGRWTSVYNRWQREGLETGERDGRWSSDETKRRHRDLTKVSTLKARLGLLASKLVCMGVMPLLTERRGFVGLEGPAGRWLEVLGVHAYMPGTLEKELTELGLLGVDEAAWRAHGHQWQKHARRWAEGGPAWLRWAVYVDASLDPYWTRHFALAGKVSRVGRVMPCLDRVAVTSGPGVPLVMETHAGTMSLKKRLVPLLRQLESWVGEGELGRLTIIDAEMAQVGLLWELAQELDRGFITVLKGAALDSAERRDFGPWRPFRQRDEVRELVVVLQGAGAPEGGFELRGVEMRRPDSRREHPTLFLCNWDQGQLPPTEVASAYLSRWPNQEQRLRNGRHGGGLERSHGYGGELVTHVAFETKLEKASRKLERAKDHLVDAKRIRNLVAKTSARQATPSDLLKTAEVEVQRAEQAVVKANNKL
ncbi:MAG: hypothetical protein HY814_00005, partial [Candidatus Riflebacteria bacterium]|nr:hypothetical protein [Candidatus Riflebacteria bacterium]